MMSSATKGGMALAAFLATSLSGAQRIQVQVDGQAVNFPDVQPQKVAGVVMVPIRSVCDKMGSQVAWDPNTQTVTTKMQGSDVILRIGDSEATVNGQMRYLDLPPRVVDGRTLVPIRFLGSGLGSEMTWNGDTNLVAITTNTNASASNTSATAVDTSTSMTTPQSQEITLHQNEVIPVTLDQPLSTTTNQMGDPFTASVSAWDGYASLPPGTKIEGHIATLRPMQDGHPGILELAFDRIDFPSGMSEPIDGSLVSMADQYVNVDDSGVYQAQDSAQTFDHMVFAGYGTTDGQLIGVTSGTAPVDAVTAQTPEDQTPTDVTLLPGTTLGVRITREDQVKL